MKTEILINFKLLKSFSHLILTIKKELTIGMKEAKDEANKILKMFNENPNGLDIRMLGFPEHLIHILKMEGSVYFDIKKTEQEIEEEDYLLKKRKLWEKANKWYENLTIEEQEMVDILNRQLIATG